MGDGDVKVLMEEAEGRGGGMRRSEEAEGRGGGKRRREEVEALNKQGSRVSR